MATSTTTYIKKITVGVPIRKVTGAAAQTAADLTDVANYDSVGPGYILVWNNSTEKWTPVNTGEFNLVGGGVAAFDSPGGDF